MKGPHKMAKFESCMFRIVKKLLEILQTFASWRSRIQCPSPYLHIIFAILTDLTLTSGHFTNF